MFIGNQKKKKKTNKRKEKFQSFILVSDERN